MAFTQLTTDVQNITVLNDLPNENDGLTADELKILFDKAGVDIKTFINNTLLVELAKTTTSQSGAQNIGAESLLGYTNVMDILKAIAGAGSGNIPPDNTLTTAKFVTTAFDTDGTLTADSDTRIASQKATKAYSDTKIPLTYLDTDTALTANSDTKVASQKASKTYSDTKIEKAIFTAVSQLLYSTGSGTYGVLNKGLDYQGLVMNSGATAPQWGSVCLLNKQIYTTVGSSTFTAPKTGWYKVIVTGGGGSSATSAGGGSAFCGGGAGATAIKWVSLNKNDSVTVTVGAGAVYPTTYGTSGNTGGTSSFGSHCSATGGYGSSIYTNYASNIITGGGSASGGDINLTGGYSGVGHWGTGDASYGEGGESYWGRNYGAGALLGNYYNGNSGIVTVEW